MTFTDLFIRRPVLAAVVSLLILVLGLRSLAALNDSKQHTPDAREELYPLVLRSAARVSASGSTKTTRRPSTF